MTTYWKTAFRSSLCRGAAALLLSASALSLTGCQKREPVLDVETPAGSLSIDKTEDPDGTKGVEIEVDP